MRSQSKQKYRLRFENGRAVYGIRGTHRITKLRKLITLCRNLKLKINWAHPMRKGKILYLK